MEDHRLSQDLREPGRHVLDDEAPAAICLNDEHIYVTGASEHRRGYV
jgi:hypothetical protein